MKFYANKKGRDIYNVLVPIFVVLSILIPLFKGKELFDILISNSFIFAMVGFGYYVSYKQSKVPVFDIGADALVINHVGYDRSEILLDNIVGIKKSFWFGYSLVTISGEVRIPLRSLSQKDRGLFFSELNLDVK